MFYACFSNEKLIWSLLVSIIILALWRLAEKQTKNIIEKRLIVLRDKFDRTLNDSLKNIDAKPNIPAGLRFKKKKDEVERASQALIDDLTKLIKDHQLVFSHEELIYERGTTIFNSLIDSKRQRGWLLPNIAPLKERFFQDIEELKLKFESKLKQSLNICVCEAKISMLTKLPKKIIASLLNHKN